jgi:hypothetical protein
MNSMGNGIIQYIQNPINLYELYYVLMDNLEDQKKNRHNLAYSHHFYLNPYSNLRFYRCPDCNNQSNQRKLPLLIHIKPSTTLAINITCRYCKLCNRLICHKDQLEHIMTCTFQERDPSIIGNDYFLLGIIERKIWRQSLTRTIYPSEMLPYLHEFTSYEELRMTEKGWFHKNQPPPMKIPPPSQEWIRKK